MPIFRDAVREVIRDLFPEAVGAVVHGMGRTAEGGLNIVSHAAASVTVKPAHALAQRVLPLSACPAATLRRLAHPSISSAMTV